MGPSETADRPQGRVLAGRYRLLELIGSGGAGNVWAAEDEVLQRRVAVKDVGAPPWLSVEGWEALRERTFREARAAAAICHPNVVTVYDVVEEDDRPWIVMQLVEARTLSQIIDEEGPCPPTRVAELGLQVLAALQAAHAHGILHRDVKPSNVLVCDDGRAVLTDFGIAAVDGDVAITASGVLVGAPAYIAPERVQGNVAGPASDLWSLGATMYTAVEGRPPYRRDSAICTIAAVVHEDPDPTSQAGALQPLLDALLRRDPDQRPTAAQVEQFLRQIVAPSSAGVSDDVTAAVTGFAAAATTTALAGPALAAAAPLATRPVPLLPAVAGTGPQTATVAAARPAAEPAERQRARTLALLSTAAAVLLAIMFTGYLARHELAPGSPTQRSGNNQPVVAPEPVADVQVGPTLTKVGTPKRAPATAGGAQPVAPAEQPASTTQPTTTSVNPEPTSSQPATTTAPPATTTAVRPSTTTAESPTTTASEPTAGDATTSAATLP